jgi:hypothetical protein
MSALRLVSASAFALAVLCTGAYAGGAFPSARAAQGQAQPAASYDRAAGGEIAIGDTLEVNGQPMKLSLFYTADAPARVIAFYTGAFIERGLLPVTAMGHVAVFDPQDGLQRFISAVPQPGGQTLVLVGITNPRRPPKLLNAAATASFPVPAEGRGFSGYRSEDAGARAECGQFVTGQSASEVAAYYRKELPALGFREGASTPGMLNFSKPGATLSVGVQALEENEGAAVFVNRLEGDATR